MSSERRCISERVIHIYDTHYQSQDEYKFNQLLDAADEYAENMALPDGYFYYINEINIARLIQSYLLDVIRYKEYHFQARTPYKEEKTWASKIHSKSINNVKIATFTTKWLLKHPPIHILTNVEEPLPAHAKLVNFANESFALVNALNHIEVDINKIPDELIGDIIYDLKFRPFEEGWVMEYFSLIREKYK